MTANEDVQRNKSLYHVGTGYWYKWRYHNVGEIEERRTMNEYRRDDCDQHPQLSMNRNTQATESGVNQVNAVEGKEIG